MGVYLTAADLQARFENDDAVAHFTDTISETGTPDADVLNEIIGRTEGQMDGYIAKRYKVPVDVTDAANLATLKSVGLDIASWYLMIRHQFSSEAAKQAYDAAIEWLKEIATGQAYLPAADTEDSTISRNPVAAFGTAGTGSTSNRLFTRDTQARL